MFYRLLLLYILLISTGCGNGKHLGAYSRIIQHNGHSRVTVTPELGNVSIVFTDTSALLNKPVSFKKLNVVSNSDIAWVGKTIKNTIYSQIKVKGIKGKIFQYVGYEDLHGNKKLVLTMLERKDFESSLDWHLSKHSYFNPVVNTGGITKYGIIDIVFDMNTLDYLIELRRK